MKYKFTHLNHQLLFSLAVLASTIMPVTSAVAILPMASEVFQTSLSIASSSNETASIIEDALSKEDLSKIENKHIKVFSHPSKFSTLIRESKQFKNIEKHTVDAL